MEPAAQPDLNEALNRLWIQFLPQIVERVVTLEVASKAAADNKLSLEQKIEANSAAHKLAGILGTFGLTKGTILAREAEILYSGDIDPASVAQLAEIAGQLRVLITSRK
jgi:HPt (histidine-containing phosphotransfer) domain-containing protein